MGKPYQWKLADAHDEDVPIGVVRLQAHYKATADEVLAHAHSIVKDVPTAYSAELRLKLYS